MKKGITLVLLILSVLSVPLFGADRVDMIVLLDNSVSVLPYYDQIQKSLLGRIVSEHLAEGDSFNLLTFAGDTEVELSREIKKRSDIDAILSYTALLQPLGSHTDLILALRFLYRYTLDLPLNYSKKIVILTDGMHDPPEDSPYYGYSASEVHEEIRKAAGAIRKQGWDVAILEIENKNPLPAFESPVPDGSSTAAAESGAGRPAASSDSAAAGQASADPAGSGAETAGSGTDAAGLSDTAGNAKAQAGSGEAAGIDVIDSVAESIGSKPSLVEPEEDDLAGIALGTPLLSVKPHMGTVSGDFGFKLRIRNRTPEPMFFSLSAVEAGDENLLKKKASVRIAPGEISSLAVDLKLPEGLSEGEQSLRVRPVLVDGERVTPDEIELNFYYKPAGGLGAVGGFLADWRVIAALAAVIVAVGLIIIIRKASSAVVVRPAGGGSRAKPGAKAAGPADSSDGYVLKGAVKDDDDEKAGNRLPAGAGSKGDESGAASYEAAGSAAPPTVAASALSARGPGRPDTSTARGDSDSPEEIAVLASEAEGVEYDIKKNRPIHMHVYGQNTKNGISNVKWLGKGHRRMIGSGGRATFKIFLVQVPAVIAEIECTGEDFIFRPIAAEYFPDLNGELQSCLYRRIKVRTPENKLFYIEFRQWISKLEQLNRIMTMTRRAGSPDMEF